VKTVLIYGYLYGWVPHNVSARLLLEIASKHTLAGDRVVILGCEGILPTCMINSHHEERLCRQCRSSLRDVITLLPSTVTYLSLDEIARDLPTPEFPAFDAMSGFRSYRVDGFDAGNAALSSTVSISGEPEPQLNGEQSAILRGFLTASMIVYRSAQRALSQIRPDIAYTYNGRFASPRGFLRACQEKGVTCRVYDVPLHDQPGENLKHYWLCENHMLHNFKRVASRIEAVWDDERVGLAEKAEQGASFFEERLEGRSRRFQSYTGKQKPDRLPSSWNPDKRNIVIFNSSEDEFVGIREEPRERGLYEDQFTAITSIAESLESDPDIELYLRIHPNLASKRSRHAERFRSLDGARLTVIPPLDPVSSYALARSAAAVVTFGSTIGIEATYLGTPSILMASTYYGDIGGAWTPRSPEEALTMIRDRDLQPNDRIAALKYGYYFGEAMEKFEHTEMEGNSIRLRASGQHLRLPASTRLLAVVRRLLSG
jgi:hypothetical protein